MRKTNGNEYEPDSLKVMLGSLDRHLKSLKFPSSLIHGVEFIMSRKVLDGNSGNCVNKVWEKKQIKLQL